MCGLAGFLTTRLKPADELAAMARCMTAPLAHRGPDDHGTWCDAADGVSLGFRRLAIVDLSQEGHQPMQSASARYVVVFNGEIYNFPDLRAELETRGHRFRGHSDTEVLLAAVDEWGVGGAVRRFNGMFAIALWDRGEKRLHLVRDRAGEKPLYFGWLTSEVFAFGSELKALQAHEAFESRVDRSSVALYLRFGYVPAPYSIFERIQKVLPGEIVTVDTRRAAVSHETYWSLRDAAAAEPIQAGDENEVVSQLDALLADSVKRRMLADVPLGAFLSGGIDSSLIVALMQRQSASAVRTFTIGFADASYDEAPYAAAVARHLRTDHTEVYVTPRDAMDVIPELPWIFDEPFSDSSQIPTFLVARIARKHVTVALSGDGGDELFGGYSRYVRGVRVWRSLTSTPRMVRRGVAGMLGLLPQRRWDSLLSGETRASRFLLARGLTGDRVAKLRDLLREERPAAVCLDMVTHWRRADALAGSRETPRTPFSDPVIDRDFAEISMYLDAMTYLPDDILVKLDRATMAVSLEGRVPLLDHRVIEFAWRLPQRFKLRGNVGKWILRRLLSQYVPAGLFERPKHGFGVPIDLWLRHELRDWAESLLDPRRLRDSGIFEPADVTRRWKQHVAGLYNWKPLLWDILMLQSWYDRQRQAAPLSDSSCVVAS
jgi:asparagine synthase (glutamine-hydrolysing)